TDFQSVDEKSQPQQKQELIDTQSERLQTSLQKNPENGQKSGDNLPDDLAEIVAAWPELPEHIKAAIKALVHTQIKGD
ncbi:MAG: hypothetical protein NTX52_05370, partial [Planctomycetota bacterium]|nr:hypothetical protein [Planctomycetota bacterium]